MEEEEKIQTYDRSAERAAHRLAGKSDATPSEKQSMIRTVVSSAASNTSFVLGRVASARRAITDVSSGTNIKRKE